jgi:hypothetical protein
MAPRQININIEIPHHDLVDFMRSITKDISLEYERIRKRSIEDPGTAGDQGEENWAELLRDWLPPNYQVVTKGRLLSYSGRTGPQIDIIVLKPSYPKYLLSKKMYLLSGVAAAFECKITLRSEDIRKSLENSYIIQTLDSRREGNPYKELYSPLFYGILAHSHSWKGDAFIKSGKIYELLYKADERYIKHPYQMIDILCVADLGTWGSWKYFNGPSINPDKPVNSLYSWHTYLDDDEIVRATPIGDMIVRLWKRLAWEDENIRDIAKYFLAVHGLSSQHGGGFGRSWSNDVFSPSTRKKVENNYMNFHSPWNEWDEMFEMQHNISFEKNNDDYC